jgi:hypothetical protein
MDMPASEFQDPFDFGICHYGKVYERNGPKCLRNKAFVKPIDKLPH